MASGRTRLLCPRMRHAASVACKGGREPQQRRCVWSSSQRSAVPSSLRLNHAIQRAEKLTGHNTSRFSEKLMNMGELHTFLGTVAKMMGSQHPIVDSVKQLLFQQSTNIQTRGLLVSLFIKACGVAERQADPLEVVLRRQQLVVNATEEFHAAQTIHASALNVAAAERDRLDPLVLDDVQTGNKMTVLAGDFFFAKAFQTTTDIGIPVMLDVFGKAVEDYVRSYFESDLKEAPFVDAMWWESKTHLKTASLLASAYRAAAMVAGHQKELQEQVYRLGKHIALALQTYHETRQFLDTPHSTGLDYDVTSLPIVLHMETHPHVLSHLKESGMKNLQFSQLQSEVLSGDALERAQVMLGYYIQEARLLARDLGSSDAADSLVTIVSSLKDL
ncbi:all trans-polyprenyl-diphosphate synthase PDSS2 [Rhipicephalus sanguineus]|uniref:all trans-polyprenyl-diphosphate synthase PDSS2 n=1 Tax=Rhipicephalus sanguineus TaxID=34632 RepID=UPI001893218B|nr:all trans-polyprenyl-diphosphate synthase PDSS2 [Rhipicephalus sanguineus]